MTNPRCFGKDLGRRELPEIDVPGLDSCWSQGVTAAAVTEDFGPIGSRLRPVTALLVPEV
mgnify:CR=1 FL=1